ncbi:3-hydroxyisobutyrate dehydrogenase [Corynebacterium sp. H113]|uniref:3-hydroxyisobutyrate dehydrogenase n=1 Tax=Corynebacterium sp. H113 TaxID=3133419 RepID=UPI003096C6F2
MSENNAGTIAFIGLGNMGGPMAANLAKAGYTVQGSDPSPEARAAAESAGIKAFENAKDAAQGAETVITMLPNGGIVGAVYADILPVVADNALFLDSSTIAVAEARELNEKVIAAGHQHLDAPVSGGVGGATAGTLAFMVGGEQDAFDRAKDVLDVMGRSVTLCGASGAGQAAKVCNNMLLAVQQIAVGEAMVLGERLGLTPQAFFDVVSNSTGACWALTANCPVPGPVESAPSNRDYQPGFAAALMDKDLGLAERALADTGTNATLGSSARAQYRRFCEEGNQGLDFSAIIRQIVADSEEAK